MPETRPTLNTATFSVTWNGERCYLGDTMLFRCLAALAAKPNVPVENDELVKAIDTGFIDMPNDVRIAVYWLKKKLIAADLKDLAERIVNVGNAYEIRI